MIVKVEPKKKGQTEEYKAVFFSREELMQEFTATANEIETQIENLKSQLDILRELTKWVSIVE